MAIDTRPNVDTELLASRIPHEAFAYVVGPFAIRVNFAAQQRRALSLVYAIHNDIRNSGDEQGLEGKNVAVVGAGLAGLTAAVAVAAYKGNAWVLEKQKFAFESMIQATHRDIHPSLNFWPQETVSPSTFLPFFNWHADSCDNVLEQIKREWDHFVDRGLAGIKGLVTECKVTKYEYRVPTTDGAGRYHIEAMLPDGKTLPKSEFDVLIFATGFGHEKSHKSVNDQSYWDPYSDSICAIQHAADSPCKQYVVSGTGDGGVIEAIRLIYKIFENGKLESLMNTVLRDSKIKKIVKSVEHEVQRQLTDSVLHSDEQQVTNELKDELSEKLWKEYSSLSDRAQHGVAFDDSMTKERTAVNHVVLLGLYATPLEPGLSPHHKFLLTYAIKKGLVTYHKINPGSVEIEDCKDRTIGHRQSREISVNTKRVTFNSLQKIDIDIDNGKFRVTEQKHDTIVDLPCCFFISRHGYESPLNALLHDEPSMATGSGEKVVITGIKRVQQLYADQDWLTIDQAHQITDGLDLVSPKNQLDWRDAHFPRIRDYFREQYGINLRQASGCVEVLDEYSGATKRERKEHFLMLTRDGKGYCKDTYERKSSVIPESFFGIEIRPDDGLSRTQSDPSGFNR